ncbi:MAG: UDP-N-acetylmuramoyl-tripeptide--D-alanyl-D-alanine ligase [Flavobacteriales bacterium]|nr:UDP-N-acetylmuramoyl-tripeptide--D-alanyl-D-alanine ligase [Flavobacteriales bacterium]
MISQLLALVSQGHDICSDSRTLAAGQIFFALKGDNFDGNTFAKAALERGAVAVVVDTLHSGLKADEPGVYKVVNALASLQELAHAHRMNWGGTLIGLTGSNGKTTAKELFRSVLSQSFNVHATDGNFNNHIGLPLTLLGLKKFHEVAVIEMGANHRGEIASLTAIAAPDIGYITNFGQAHLEGFGGIDGVIQGKIELYQWLTSHGKPSLVNDLDPLQMQHAGNNKLPSSKGVVCQSKDQGVHVTIGDARAQSHLVGDFHSGSLVASVNLGRYMGMADEAIAQGIEAYIPSNNRGQWLTTDSNRIFLDAYNANPSSMEASLLAVHALHPELPHVYIAGDIFEMGSHEKSAHQGMVNLMQTLDLKTVHLVGLAFSKTQAPPTMVKHDNTKDALVYLESNPVRGAMVWIKASRGMALEGLLEAL